MYNVGQSTMKQYLPMKPVKRGFKVWVVADSANGDVQVYVGKESNTSEHGLGERVVLQLNEDKAYRIFCNNFFTSPVLFKELHEHGLYACGTVRQTRRGFPEDLHNPSLALGESLFRQNESLTQWCGKTSGQSMFCLPSLNHMRW